MNPFPETLHNHLGEQLDFTLHRAASEHAPVVIIGHGVTGHKDRPLLIALGEALARNGVNALRISFSGNGASAGRFEESTVLKEVKELGAVLDALPQSHAGYIGHSMGAAVGVLRAAEDSRIQFLISLAGIVHTAAFAEREFGNLKPGVDTMWEKPGCVLSVAYLEAMRQTNNVLDAAGRIRAPWLLVHGTADDVVPVQDSRDIGRHVPEAKRVEIDGADHLFSEHTPQVTDAVVDWITHLKR
ncbi:MAG TPA: alpha/beta fold hydrolase [Opitutus sp.]|nr:alpha/beta fold hydrolase [Opitutus sp.]